MLSSEQVRKIFPVAPRDRRENSRIFSPFLDEGSLKQDDLFYGALAKMIAGEGIEALRDYDARMVKSRRGRKRFGFRATRFLLTATIGDYVLEDLPGLSPDHFSSNTE